MKYLLLLFALVPSYGISQQADPDPPHYPGVLKYKNDSCEEKVVSSLFEWELKREQIKDSLQALFGKLPPIPTIPPFKDDSEEFPLFNASVKDSLVTMHYTRYNIQFTVASGESVTAYLYIPKAESRMKNYRLCWHCTKRI